MKAYIDYFRLLSGEYKRARRYGPFNPLASYYEVRGATVRTNDFADKNLSIEKEEPLFIVLFKLITSARLQVDFSQLRIVSIPDELIDTCTELKFLEEISLCEIEIHNQNSSIEIYVNLKEKEAYKMFVEPYKSRTNLHPDYKTQQEIDVIIEQKVPKIPSVKDIRMIANEYKIVSTRIISDIIKIREQIL